MPQMVLDLSHFERALDLLDRALLRAKKDPSDLEVRDSVIKRFEYSFELAWKLLKKRLEMDAASPALLATLSFKILFREAAAQGLITNPTAWFSYRDKRNLTAHTYSNDNAEAVCLAAGPFAQDARRLLETLQQRNSAP